MEYANILGDFCDFLDILDDLDRYAILGSLGRQPINSLKGTAPQVNSNKTRRMGYTRIEHLAGGAAGSIRQTWRM